jgi:hypothetical protein
VRRKVSSSGANQGCWQRQVDRHGTISLCNRNYSVGRALAHQKVWVCFAQGEWVISTAKGTEVTHLSAVEINADIIVQWRFVRSQQRWLKLLSLP